MGKIALVFAGQGAQYPGMGKSLYEVSAAARAVFDLAERLRPGTLTQCFEGTKEELTVTRNTQPCLYCVDLAAACALREAGVDALVLGCTHYPLLTDVIRAYMGPGVALINVGEACAGQVAGDLRAADALADRDQGRRQYFVSDSVDDFARLASIFLGEDVEGHVEQVDITRY